MAPKWKQQRQTSKNPAISTSKTHSCPPSSSTSSTRLQLSAENEDRLRRLLLNSGQATQSVSLAHENLSKEKKAKKFSHIYERLSCEGFSDDRIELVLSTLRDAATFETALDWLCLNLSRSELPLKFCAAISAGSIEGSVGVLSTGKGREISPTEKDTQFENEAHEFSIRIKSENLDSPFDRCEPSQADWVRKYMLQQEEKELETWEDYEAAESSTCKIASNRSFEVILEEYYAARIEASKAKEVKDKKRQEHASKCILQLKHELSLLGYSDEFILQDFEKKYRSKSDISCTGYLPSEDSGTRTFERTTDGNAFVNVEPCSNPLVVGEPAPYGVPDHFTTECDLEEVELGDLFLDNGSSSENVDSQVLEFQKKEKLRELCCGKNLEALNKIWKQGDPKKVPKAFLQQFCLKSGWEAPKFNRNLGDGTSFPYSISILRNSSGRGRNRKAGGLITFQIPENDQRFESLEDAQNKVSTYALHQLLPDFPLQLVLTEPYALLYQHWKEEDSAKLLEEVMGRRDLFLDQLLSTIDRSSHVNVDVEDDLPNDTLRSHVESNLHFVNSFSLTRPSHDQDLESTKLKQSLEQKMELPKYQENAKNRASLPVAALKDSIMQTLKDNNVIVVCGETGSGKTTQIPQFILDDMIISGFGGVCNIICTQPRRIAAISVAERVADERCDPPPGVEGSLVGYQVRLQNARNESTKLCFCTTGILLRRLVGDNNLSGVTHVIVDEVHERSLLGDFLLIILKNIVEKQATEKPSLKVVLMSATIDSDLFSSYFGCCPVLRVEGRTHPVTSYYLEDIYESLDYNLPCDSPVAFGYKASSIYKNDLVKNHRSKKNIVLSSWGNEAILSDECSNPNFTAADYSSYGEQTQKNLKRLNEDIIDYDLLEDLVGYIDDTYGEGAILIFMPGLPEINLLIDRLAASVRFGGQAADWICPLHSSIVSADQKKVFKRPPKGIRKIIVSTNIAETSITIDDVVYVIDCGKHKENRYNPQKKLSCLVEDWISKANAKQRRGRAGRVKPGVCFCLYTRYRIEKLMHNYQIPEMLRLSLVDLCLQIKVLSLGYAKPVLLKALEPPKEYAVNNALSLLYEVGAIEGNESLTPLGHLLAKLPVDVLIGKMLIFSAIFGCLSPILSISAFLSYKSPFMQPKNEQRDVERAKVSLLNKSHGSTNCPGFSDAQSDHITMMLAYRSWARILQKDGIQAARQFCNSFYLSSSVLYMIRDIRVQLGTLLSDLGFFNIPDSQYMEKRENLDLWLSDHSQPFNMYSDYPAVLKAVLCAGLYPHIAATEEGVTSAALTRNKKHSNSEKKVYPAWYDGRREVHIHPSSINSSQKAFHFPFAVFLEKVETNKVFLRDITIVSPFSVLLFGGTMNVQHQSGQIIVDDWLKLTAPAQTAVLCNELRKALQSFLTRLIRNPKETTNMDNELVRSVIHLLLEEDKTVKK